MYVLFSALFMFLGFWPRIPVVAMGRAEQKARDRAKRQKDAVRVLRREMGDVHEFSMAHRRKQEHREGQFRREVTYRALQMRGRFGGVRDQQ